MRYQGNAGAGGVSGVFATASSDSFARRVVVVRRRVVVAEGVLRAGFVWVKSLGFVDVAFEREVLVDFEVVFIVLFSDSAM